MDIIPPYLSERIVLFQNQCGSVVRAQDRLFVHLEHHDKTSMKTLQELLDSCSKAFQLYQDITSVFLDSQFLRAINKESLAFILSCWKNELMKEQHKVGYYMSTISHYDAKAFICIRFVSGNPLEKVINVA
ncbi:MAG: hypothetical protein NZM38_08615 [Cytophagales bacterium]|nr:hypothetical protein [Cytophagales bacterium]MDW8384820.1 hypothetical protein [Flammeovirgaceae bacterium]